MAATQTLGRLVKLGCLGLAAVAVWTAPTAAVPVLVSDVFTAATLTSPCPTGSPGPGTRLCQTSLSSSRLSTAYSHSLVDELALAGFTLANVVSVISADIALRFWDQNAGITAETLTVTFDDPASASIVLAAVAGGGSGVLTTGARTFLASELGAFEDGALSGTVTRNSGAFVFQDSTLTVTYDVEETTTVPAPAPIGLLGLGLLIVGVLRSRSRA